MKLYLYFFLILCNVSGASKKTYGSMSSYGNNDEPIELVQDSYSGNFGATTNLLAKRENNSSIAGYVFAGWLTSSAILDAITIGLGYYGRTNCPKPCDREDHLTTLTTASAVIGLVSAGISTICAMILYSKTGKKQCAIGTMAMSTVVKLVVLSICLSSFAWSFPYQITRESMCDASVGIAGIELVLIFAAMMPEGCAEILVELLSIIWCVSHD